MVARPSVNAASHFAPARPFTVPSDRRHPTLTDDAWWRWRRPRPLPCSAADLRSHPRTRRLTPERQGRAPRRPSPSGHQAHRRRESVLNMTTPKESAGLESPVVVEGNSRVIRLVRGDLDISQDRLRRRTRVDAVGRSVTGRASSRRCGLGHGRARLGSRLVLRLVLRRIDAVAGASLAAPAVPDAVGHGSAVGSSVVGSVGGSPDVGSSVAGSVGAVDRTSARRSPDPSAHRQVGSAGGRRRRITRRRISRLIDRSVQRRRHRDRVLAWGDGTDRRCDDQTAQHEADRRDHCCDREAATRDAPTGSGRTTALDAGHVLSPGRRCWFRRVPRAPALRSEREDP